ncbi:MAG: GNAT family N-acetyltransferase, partial [Pseudomonadota bacterium]
DSYCVPQPSSLSTVSVTIQIAPLPPKAEAQTNWDSKPSWQNDLASLTAAGKNATCFTIRDANGLVAYAIFVPANATVAQLVVRRDQRRRGLGTALLTHGMHRLGLQTARIINIDRADIGTSAFLRAIGAEPLVSQREVVLQF